MNAFRIAVSTVVVGPESKVLLVREADRRAYGKINLPGGHLENGESVVACAIREVQEETGLAVTPSGFLGAYLQGDLANFVFMATCTATATRPGHDILSCEWLAPQEILAIPESNVIRPRKLRTIIQDLMSGRCYPNEVVRALE